MGQQPLQITRHIAAVEGAPVACREYEAGPFDAPSSACQELTLSLHLSMAD